MKNEKILLKKLNWNENLLDSSELVIDKELNTGLILCTGSAVQNKTVKKSKGYSDLMKSLKDKQPKEIMDILLEKELYDYYLQFILSTDKFYSGKNGTYTVKMLHQTTFVLYKSNNKLFLKCYSDIYNADNEQQGYTTTLFIIDITEIAKHSFVLIEDLEVPEKIKGVQLESVIQAINNFNELKTISAKERQDYLINKIKLLKEQSEKDIHYISLQTQGIEKRKRELIEKIKKENEQQKSEHKENK